MSLLPCAFQILPVILQPGVSDREPGFLRHIPLVDADRDLVIDDFLAPLADQIDVLLEIRFAAVFHLVKLKRLDDSMTGKLVEGRIGG